MQSKEKISVITLGCSKNTVDSERLLNQLKVNSFNLTDEPEKAEIVIINTCGFIEAAKQESIDTILNAVELKNQGKLKKVIVAGCLSERYMNDLRKEIPNVDAFFGAEKYEGILNEVGGKLRRELLGERVLKTPSHTAYLKISEGCDHPCSFCAIPLMRGLHKSKPMEELIRETEFLAANNTKELILIAQDTTDYGKDIYGKKMLAELLNRLSYVQGIKWIRLMYAYPSHFPEDVIDVVAGNPKICKYIDIPLQHISDNVLKSMRRGITGKGTRNLLNKLRDKIPGITLRTTFIVGYPNEGEKEFEELCEFVKETEFDRIGTFTYSVEDNTPSFILGDQVPEKEKLRRKEILMEIQKDISFKKNKEFINTKLNVLVESVEGCFYLSRSYRDAPEVDGEVLIDRDHMDIKTGNFYIAEIYDNDEYDLYAKIVNNNEELK
jgi:ribosomal protein S12 methylthiotransferase